MAYTELSGAYQHRMAMHMLCRSFSDASLQLHLLALNAPHRNQQSRQATDFIKYSCQWRRLTCRLDEWMRRSNRSPWLLLLPIKWPSRSNHCITAIHEGNGKFGRDESPPTIRPDHWLSQKSSCTGGIKSLFWIGSANNRWN